MFCRRAHSLYATKHLLAYAIALPGNLTRCVDACDFRACASGTSLCKEADHCLQGG